MLHQLHRELVSNLNCVDKGPWQLLVINFVKKKKNSLLLFTLTSSNPPINWISTTNWEGEGKNVRKKIVCVIIAAFFLV